MPSAFARTGRGLYVGPAGTSPCSVSGLPAGERSTPRPFAETSPEVREVNAGSIDAWIATVTASSTATDDELAAATAALCATQFTPDQVDTDGVPTAG